MPNPIINPATWAAEATYTTTNTSFVALDINLTGIDEDTALIYLTVPVGGEVVVLRDPVDWTGAGGISILNGGAWTGALVDLGDWEISVTTPGVAVTDQATISVASAMSDAGGRLRIILTELAGQATVIGYAGDSISIDRVLVEPEIINVQTTPVSVSEQDEVTLSASVSMTVAENGTPSLALLAPPDLLSRWQQDPANTIALNDFLADLVVNETSATATFTAPPIYAPSDLTFNITAALDLDASGTIEISDPQTTEQKVVAIQTINYGMVLVLDRSGSMGSSLGGGLSKWEAATQAAHAWTDLFRAFRPGEGHLAGVVTFEHDNCSWIETPAGDITLRDPSDASPLVGLEPLENFGDVNTWDLGTVQSCTPIGDALVKTWKDIQTGLTPDHRASVILMTDGYENSGRVTIASDAGLADTTFDAERTTPALNVANDLIGDRVYTLAIGTFVDDDRLNELGSAYYQQISNDLNEVIPALGGMLGNVLDAERLTAEVPLEIDPTPPANPLYYRVPAKEQTLVFLVTWKNITDSLEIGWREQNSSDSFATLDPGALVSVTVTQRGTHGLIRVDINGVVPATQPATEWRLEHISEDLETPPLTHSNALAMVDLVTKVTVGFDQKQYFIGDEINLSCSIRSGGVRVTDATVGVDCARPGEGLGTFLTTNSGRYKKIQVDSSQKPGPDPDQGKGLMFKTLLKALELDNLPVVTPPQFHLFDDGAHGDGQAADGDFADAYTDTVKEGTYTFRFRISGKLADGSQFSRIFTRSTWVGVRPDPGLLNPIWTTIDNVGGSIISQVTFMPQTAKPEYLGPYRTAAIKIGAHDGELDGPLIDNFDGFYSQRVIHANGVDPILEIEIYGKPMKPTGPGIDNIDGKHLTNCWKLWMRAIRCTLTWLFRLIFRK